MATRRPPDALTRATNAWGGDREDRIPGCHEAATRPSSAAQRSESLSKALGVRAYFRLPDLSPVVSLVVTSRRTRGASVSPCSDRNARTRFGSCATTLRSAHDRAFTTMSSRSAASSPQSASVRSGSPCPPRARSTLQTARQWKSNAWTCLPLSDRSVVGNPERAGWAYARGLSRTDNCARNC